jgi:hypothetical protein
MSFDHLTKLEVRGKTQRFPIPALEGDDMVLIVLPATEANKPFFNKQLKQTQTQGGLRNKRRNLNDRDLEMQRESDKALYSRYVLTDWENVFDDDGQAVPFSVEAAAEFLDKLPNWLFDDLRFFCTSPNNFIELMDVEEKSKN